MRGREEKGRDSPTIPEKKRNNFFENKNRLCSKTCGIVKIIEEKRRFFKIYTIRKVTLL